MQADRNSNLIPSNRESVFVYEDTSSTRAGISKVARRLRGGSIAVIGLGGTGSEVADLICKTPCTTIKLIDGDIVEQHTAWRSPGAMSLSDIAGAPFKVDHYAAIYGRMHRGIEAHPIHLGPDNLALLDDVDFVFVCVDSVATRAFLIPELEARDLAFIDCGLGLRLVGDKVMGQVRVTTSTPAMRSHVHDNARIPVTGDDNDDLYRSNIQIGDLNRLAAVMAVIQYKQLRGFYADSETEYHSVYTVDSNLIINADHRCR